MRDGDQWSYTIANSGYDGGIDKPIFSDRGLSSSSVRATRVNISTDVQRSFGNTSNSVLLQNQLSSRNSGLEYIQFSNGVTWNKSQLLSALS